MMRLLARHPQEGTAWEDAYKQCVARQGTVGSGLDASWADVVPQRKSSLSYLIFCNNAVFSWKSSLSSVLAMSSAEAELIALCACAADVAYCRKLANELGFLQLRPTIIHEDNVGAKQLAESGNFKGRSKHFEVR
jgi:hypothetical protein